MQNRIEKDSMGTMEVPGDALYGATTQRAVLNFPISGYRFSRPFIRALGLVKWSAALANRDLGKLEENRAQLIAQAAEEVIDGRWDAQFPIDIFQTGSGTSTNMNANEVIANRCSLMAGKPIGSKEPVHPNDHVNMSQSSNDVIPTSHSYCGGGIDSERIDAGVGSFATRLRDESARVLGRHQDRANAFDGCHSGPAGTRIERIRQAGRIR